jgi:mono/diheme cytochrome c family protein
VIEIELRGPFSDGDNAVEQTILRHVSYAGAPHVAPSDTTDADLDRGQRLFNATYGCAHGHGTNAEGATMETNLRTLDPCYGEEAETGFMETLLNGRDDPAMPPSEGVISDDKIHDVEAFIFSLQETE